MTDTYLMPAEGAPQDRVWMAFPSAGYSLGDTEAEHHEARSTWAAVAHAIADFEPVTLLVDPDEIGHARKYVSADIEIVEALDHPASDKAPFGQAVKARSALGGGWLGWVVSVDDISVVEERLGRSAVAGNRHRPDGTELRWQQIGVNGTIADPQLPFFVQWDVAAELHPSAGADEGMSLACLEIAGDPQRVSEWLGETVEAPLEDVKVEWVAPHGTPGILAAQVQTPAGLIRI